MANAIFPLCFRKTPHFIWSGVPAYGLRTCNRNWSRFWKFRRNKFREDQFNFASINKLGGFYIGELS